MFEFTKQTNSIRNDTIIAIEEDVKEFVQLELLMYKQNPDNTRLDNSIIVNLALFDLSSLEFKAGYEQMVNLLVKHNDQFVDRRMRQLLVSLYLRYGKDAIDDVSIKTLDYMHDVFGVNKESLSALDEQFNTFWLQPFISKAYYELMFDVKLFESENK